MVSLRKLSDPGRVIRCFSSRTGVASTNMPVALVMPLMIADARPEKSRKHMKTPHVDRFQSWVMGTWRMVGKSPKDRVVGPLPNGLNCLQMGVTKHILIGMILRIEASSNFT